MTKINKKMFIKAIQTAMAFTVVISLIFVSPSYVYGWSASDTNKIPYENYVYSEKDGSVLLGPQAYLPQQVITGDNLGIDHLETLSDIHAADDGLLYFLDTGNNRVIVISADGALKRVLTLSGDELSEAKGIFVDDTYVYIADSGNQRIVILDKETGEIIKIVNAPQSDILEEDFKFNPISLTVDSSRIMYIVGEGVYKGIISMDWEGRFLGFIGSLHATASVWENFWLRVSTKQQRNNMLQFISQDYSSIDIDGEGFFYCTLYSTKYSSNMVRRLNPGGNNVLRSLSKIPIAGDPTYRSGSVRISSSFTDVACGPNGMYACLDSTSGKIFCYNGDGYLLYTFGALSGQNGGFSMPVAVTWMKDDRVAVVDQGRGSITIFAPTEYALAIHRGTEALAKLDYETAYDLWGKVLSMNAGFELAHSELGKSYMKKGQYSEAMSAFLVANNSRLYSEALKQNRSAWITENVNLIAVVIVLLILAVIVLRILYRKHKPKQEEDG